MGQEAQPDHSWNNHDPDVKMYQFSLLCNCKHTHESSGHALLGLASFSQQ